MEIHQGSAVAKLVTSSKLLNFSCLGKKSYFSALTGNGRSLIKKHYPGLTEKKTETQEWGKGPIGSPGKGESESLKGDKVQMPACPL